MRRVAPASWWRSKCAAGLPAARQPHGGRCPGALEQPTRDIPAPGDVWVDAPLLESLNLAMGDKLLLGDAQLRIAHHRHRAGPGRGLHDLRRG